MNTMNINTMNNNITKPFFQYTWNKDRIYESTGRYIPSDVILFTIFIYFFDLSQEELQKTGHKNLSLTKHPPKSRR